MITVNMDTYREQLVCALQQLVRIPSIKEEPLPGKPFGAPAYEALEAALALCREMGLETENFDGYAGHATYWAEGAAETVGVLGHLDVVPLGEGWHYPPFEGVLDNGCIYGRGVLDDKGPAVAALFGFKALLDAGFKPKKNVRFIFGCDEESGWACMEHYGKCVKMPDMAIVPDGDFPVIHAEKGITHLALKFAMQNNRVMLRAGSRANVVPDRAQARIGGGKLETVGKTAHGSLPHEGDNAVAHLLPLLLERDDLGEIEPFIRFLADKIGSETDGASMGIALRDDVSGALTLNLGVLDANETGACAVIDIRYPVTVKLEQVLEGVKAAAAPYGVSVEELHSQAPLYLPTDHPLVATLMEVFRQETGEKCDKPLAIGGGTYARALPNAAAFGPGWKDNGANEHGPDERVRISWLLTAARIYAAALARLTEG